jgi:hypothetical protein
MLPSMTVTRTRRTGRSRPFLAAILAASVALVARAMPEPTTELESPGSPEDGDASVRRWEYVVVVRTSDEVPDAFGRAQAAAFRSGGAVLADMRTDWDGHVADWRLLVRTRREDAIHPILREIRSQKGVLGATAVPLPETPTWDGGPGFLSSYMAPTDEPETSNAGRVLVHHDVPPIADKRELLEATDVIAGPDLQTPNGMLDAPGGFTLNVSEMMAKMKQASWQKREERLRNGYLPILPSSPEDAAAEKKP